MNGFFTLSGIRRGTGESCRMREPSLFPPSMGCLVPPRQAGAPPVTSRGLQLSPSSSSCSFLLPFLIILWSLLGVKLLVFLLIIC